MKWEKMGKIVDHNTLDLPWFKKNAMVPLPYVKDDKALRIYLTMCDEENVGRIGFIDVDINDLTKILDYSREPLIDIGDVGHFDDNGVVTSSLYEEDGKLYLFYSSYQTCVKVPYMIFTGLAVSTDNGDTFTKLTDEIPLLDRVPGECGTRCCSVVMKEDDKYRMWYTSDCQKGWIRTPTGRTKPFYDGKYMESDNLMSWPQGGQSSIPFIDPDEHGICSPSVWKEDGKYKMMYSIRYMSKGYRLGYAESDDGIHFTRMDDKVGIDVSSKGFDDDMICYAERISIGSETYLIYCGNHYGLDGIGYAKLVEK